MKRLFSLLLILVVLAADPVFAAANGDAFIDIDVREQIDLHLSTGASITIALTKVEDPWNYGIARVESDGRISEFKDKPNPEEVFSNLINAGVYVVNRSVLAYVAEHQFFDFSMDLVPIITKKGERVQGYQLTKGIWIDVGRPRDLIRANLVAAERYGSNSCNAIQSNVVTEGHCFVGKGTFAEDAALISSVVLNSCQVRGCRITESLIMEGCNLEGVTISNSILGKNCTISKGAIIRDSVLRDGTTISEGMIVERRVG